MTEQNNKIIVAPVQQSPVMLRRELAKVPAVMDALKPIEKAVFISSTAKTIAEYGSAELSAELAVALKWIAKDIGYRATDESDKQYLVIRTAEILKRYYSYLTLKDFRMAFEMSITGELDDYLPKGRDGQPDRNHYQQFNAEYVCKILNAYKGRRAVIMKKANDARPVEEKQPNPERQRYYRNLTKYDCIFAYYYYKYRGQMPKLSSIGEMLCYDTLSAVGLADEIVVTPEDQKNILQRVMNEFIMRGRLADLHRIRKAGPQAEELQHRSFILARRRSLEKTFSWMVRQEIQITDYIKFE